MKRVFGALLARRTETVVECKHCGTTITAEQARCPSCDRTEFATYDCLQ